MTGPDRGPDILQGGHSPYPPAGEIQGAAVLASAGPRVVKVRKLYRAACQRLAGELTLSPRESGYDEAEWSGALLASHLLLRYGIHLAPAIVAAFSQAFARQALSDARKRNQRSTILHLYRDRPALERAASPTTARERRRPAEQADSAQADSTALQRRITARHSRADPVRSRWRRDPAQRHSDDDRGLRQSPMVDQHRYILVGADLRSPA